MQASSRSCARPDTHITRATARSLTLVGLAAVAIPCAAVDDGIFADGFDADCSLPLTCPAPSAGKSCIAGQLTDAVTTQPLHATSDVALTCTSGASGGPCDLTLNAFDALAFEQNPAASTPLASAESVVDGCGRFRLSGLSEAPSSGVALVWGDGTGATGHTPTATLHALATNQVATEVNTIVATSSAISLWFAAGGIADTTHGLVLLQFAKDGTPESGVAVSTGGNGVGAIRYFGANDTQRAVPLMGSTSTGANGSALVANSPYTSLSGTKTGIVCSSVSTASFPGFLVFAELACQ